MPSPVSSFARESAVGADDLDDIQGSTIIATQRRHLREWANRVVEATRHATAVVRPLLTLSKYSLGVVLILCVTVIWVASSVWIQHIFGSLEFNKPFFLTYFNTTGFCFWNAGYFLSARWRRTPWDETSQPQPICVEDARLCTRDEPGAEEGAAEQTVETQIQMTDLHPTPLRVGGADDVVIRAMPPPHSRTVSGVSLSLSQAERHGQATPPPRPLARELSSALLLQHTTQHSAQRSAQHTTQSSLLGSAAASRSVGAATHTYQGSTPPLAYLFPTRQPLSGGDGTSGSLRVDNDDADDDSHIGSVDGSAATELHVADAYRDYSLPTSSASSACEEVVSVTLTDEDAGGDAASWAEETRRATVISSDMLHHDGSGAPPRRRYHIRARRQRIRRYCLRRIWTCALYFCPLWFLANYLFNLSLSITSVASNTVLSSTSSIWTLLLSYVLLRQPVGVHRLAAVALSVSGTIMVGLSDKNASSGRNTVGGDIVALLSAFFYAAYTSVLKFYLPDDERFAMGMVFGAVGVLNFLLLWPGLLLLSVTGAEPFAWPSWQQFWPLLMNSLIGTNLSDVLWARSVVLTSPVVATLGLSLTTPLAMVVDAVFQGARFSGVYVAGATLVMAGFLLANLPIQINWGV
ncbi:EamA-like transporter family [Novymonas esmeraldas]|uniref:EamA-like transporter family n=1 Tax=Novymonas esmeraldas TaxID=1808958 RepID=A0AAW0ENU0_9TRYP